MVSSAHRADSIILRGTSHRLARSLQGTFLLCLDTQFDPLDTTFALNYTHLTFAFRGDVGFAASFRRTHKNSGNRARRGEWTILALRSCL